LVEAKLRLLKPRENRMNVHKNARLTPRGRERIVRQVAASATAFESSQPVAFEFIVLGMIAAASI
jgi:hypothetical protein